MSMSIPEDYYVEMAEKAYRFEDDNFVCWDERVGDTHFLVGPVVHRDSDILEQSNFQFIYADLLEEDGVKSEDVFIVHSDHWAVGWVDQIAVRMFREDILRIDNPEIECSDLHPAFIAVVDWHEALTAYPVASDEHFSEMEFNRCIDNLFNSCNYFISRDDCKRVYGYLFDLGHQDEEGWFADAEVREAVFEAYKAGEIDVWDKDDLEDLALYALEEAIKEKANV